MILCFFFFFFRITDNGDARWRRSAAAHEASSRRPGIAARRAGIACTMQTPVHITERAGRFE